ncbi:4'-phosphopantetheinyl transferase EntD, partial [Escherichia coli EC1846]
RIRHLSPLPDAA